MAVCQENVNPQETTAHQELLGPKKLSSEAFVRISKPEAETEYQGG